MKQLFASCTAFCFLILILTPAQAHEIRPAALDLAEQPGGWVSVRWKQPILSGRVLKLRPVLPDHCGSETDRTREITGSAIIETWRTQCLLDKGTVTIAGLENTLTDVFVRVRYNDGQERNRLLRPADRSFSLDEQSSNSPASAYLQIGAEHMLFGWDHLLFVLGLLLLTPLRQLLWVITAFTVGHSITLAIRALDIFSLPNEPVELLIALSIFFLAVEVVRKRAGKSSLAIRNPWIVATGFGLLHGLGFAGALADIGLPQGQEIWALLLFNLGVELGQIVFVAGTLALFWLVGKLPVDRQKWMFQPALYLVGSLGAYYTLSRIFI